MNKEEFFKLNPHKQIEYVNSQLKLGFSRDVIAKTVGYDRCSFNRKTKRYNYDFDENLQQFIKATPSNDEVISMQKKIENKVYESEVIKGNNKVLLEENNVENKADTSNVTTSNNKVIPKKKNKKDVQEIIKQTLQEEYPELKEMVELFRNNSRIITANTKKFDLENEKLKGNVVSKSFKTYENVLNEFIEFCRMKKETQKDLLALALIEFMEKYR